MNLLNDIYYSKEYVSLNLKENEEVFEFKYEENEKIFYNIAIKRPILRIGTQVIKDNYFDLETAYGYGGYYTNSDDIDFLKEAFKAYEEKCKKDRIIAEFIRFYPFNNFPLLYDEFLDFNYYDRDTVFVNCEQTYEEIRKNYSSSLRRNINKAKKLGLKYKLEEINEITIKKFYTLYNMTMKKNNASKFYFFDLKYFEDLLKIKNVQLHSIYLNEKIISMIITLNSKNIISYHLGATDCNYYSYNPNPFMFDSILKQYEKTNCLFYLGGGTTSNKDDSLFKFKKKFSSLTKPFYIGGKIFNKEIYSKYVNLWEKEVKKDVKYFLKYRLEVE